MQNLALDQLTNLAQQENHPSISIFLPTHRVGQQTEQNPIRFKNLLREAERRLGANGMDPHSVKDLLKPAHSLLKDEPFWQHQQEGLAVYISPGDFAYFQLPYTVGKEVIIARSYYVRPMLPLFNVHGHFCILAISQNDVRFFTATEHSVNQVDLPASVPTSLADALKYDDPEKHLNLRSAGGGDAVFHGQGSGDDEQKVRIERYLNLVDTGLQDLLSNQRVPLVLAGVEYLLAIYRRVSKYAHIMEQGITGSPEQLRPAQLQAKAWQIVKPYFKRDIEGFIEQYHQLASLQHDLVEGEIRLLLTRMHTLRPCF